MYGLVMIIGVMMMRLLNGTMVTKNGRHRKHKLKKSQCLLLGIHKDGGIGVSLTMKKEAEKLWK